MASHQPQKDLVRERFTRTAQVFGESGERELVFTNTTFFVAGEKL
jgi:hypothetical protein